MRQEVRVGVEDSRIAIGRPEESSPVEGAPEDSEVEVDLFEGARRLPTGRQNHGVRDDQGELVLPNEPVMVVVCGVLLARIFRGKKL